MRALLEIGKLMKYYLINMIEVKYIYFEIRYNTGVVKTEPRIENENVLLIKPHTNSSGYWGCSSMTEQKRKNGLSYSIVEQNWIDLDKFNESDHLNYRGVLDKYELGLKSQIQEVLNILNPKLRDIKINLLIN
mgnify:CR=1 FL=1